MLRSKFIRAAAVMLACAASSLAMPGHAQAPAALEVHECVHDASVQERFIPVELLTGLPMGEQKELVFAPVSRVYPFVDTAPNSGAKLLETSLSGPVKWVGEGGVEFEVYERKVPRAHERFALTPDRTAIGRVFDERFGNAVNEGKFPVGLWKQGQVRTYATVYPAVREPKHATTTVEIEKLSCTYAGIKGALQYRWKNNRGGLDYRYVYAPGQGLVQVTTFQRGR